MNGPRFRAWRFLIPGIEAADDLAGVSLTAGGAIGMVEGHESIRQAIVLLLSTVPGERVMRPDYGCDLRRLVFSPNDETTAGLAIYYVRRALERWEARVQIERLDAVRHSEDPEGLEILLEYRVRATRQVAPLALSVDLGSGSVGSVERGVSRAGAPA